MDDSKLPYRYSSDPELIGIKPLVYTPITKSSVQQNQQEINKNTQCEPARVAPHDGNKTLFNEKDDFPPLGSLIPGNRSRANKNGWRH